MRLYRSADLISHPPPAKADVWFAIRTVHRYHVRTFSYSFLHLSRAFGGDYNTGPRRFIQDFL
jgi:hypothetical protein